MSKELSGVTVVVFIAGGILTLILLFIFVKRQIMRFALRSRRGPHAPIGHDAKKSFRREIDRRIEVIPKIIYEPSLLDYNNPKYILPPSENSSNLTSLQYRQRAVDDVKKLEAEIAKNDKTLVRHPSENLRVYLLNTLATPAKSISQRTVHQFCDLYEHARYDPNDFTEEEYRVYSRILLKLIDAARMLKGYSNIRKSSPNNRTPMKKVTMEKSFRNTLKEDELVNDDCRKRSTSANSEKSGETPV